MLLQRLEHLRIMQNRMTPPATLYWTESFSAKPDSLIRNANYETFSVRLRCRLKRPLNQVKMDFVSSSCKLGSLTAMTQQLVVATEEPRSQPSELNACGSPFWSKQSTYRRWHKADHL